VLQVARKNVERFGLEERIELRKGDLLDETEVSGANDNVIVVANLPYVESDAELNAEVKDYEPHLALFAGEDGLDCYCKLLKQVQVIQPLAVFLEIDPKQVDALREVSCEFLPEYKVEVVKDLAGKKRVFVLKRVIIL
jgi:release factor glutamine methyltransferase